MRPLHNVASDGKIPKVGALGEAKISEKAKFTVVNEHFELIFTNSRRL